MTTRRCDDPEALGMVSADLPEAVQMAWWTDLMRFAELLRTNYPALWPDPPKEGDHHARRRRKPWPRCWWRHIGLVEDLLALKVWQEGLRDGARSAGGAKGWLEWRAFLTGFALDVQITSQQCAVWHDDMAPEPLSEPVPKAVGAGGGPNGQDRQPEGSQE